MPQNLLDVETRQDCHCSCESHDAVNAKLHRLTFSTCDSDPFLHGQKQGSEFVIIALYVDDPLLASHSSDLVSAVKAVLLAIARETAFENSHGASEYKLHNLYIVYTTHSLDSNSQDAGELTNARVSFQQRMSFIGLNLAWGGGLKIPDCRTFPTLAKESPRWCQKGFTISLKSKTLASRVLLRKSWWKLSLVCYCDVSWDYQEDGSSVIGFVSQVLTQA